MFSKKKDIIIIGCVILIVALIGGAYFLFFNDQRSDILGYDKAATQGKVLTATFITSGLDSFNELNSFKSKEKISCTIKAGNNSCKITLPTYNVIGSYSVFWSATKLPKKDLTKVEWNANYFYGVGSVYELTQNMTFYPNTNSFHSDWGNEKNENYSPYFKYRNFDIVKSEKIGNTIFEFENGIPTHYINRYLTQVKQIYSDIPWLFIPTKIFALTEETYKNYSIAYGLTQPNYYKDYESWNTLVSTIDLQYDKNGSLYEEIPKNSISLNATIHELAHAWDSYYRFNNRAKSNPMLICETTDTKKLYDSVKKSGVLYEDENGYISEVEFFAGMVTNYYWHVLERGPNKPYYGLKDYKSLSLKQKQYLKTFIEKYVETTEAYKKN